MATPSTLLLQGKVAIVTGSSSGIGEGIAYDFVRQGASVTLHGRNVEHLESVEKKCIEIAGNKEKVLTVTGDVTQEDIRIKLIQDTLNKFGKLDILVNNAGYALSKALSFDFELTRLDAMLDIHVRVPFHLTKLAIPHLVKTKGNVINISSGASKKSFGSQLVEYGIAKAAMDHFTRFAALELGPKTVRVNCINPGGILTRVSEKHADIKPEDISKLLESFAKIHALQRMGTPDEIGKVATFLASDGASFVTGITMSVDGGVLLTPPSVFQQDSQ